MPTRLKHIRSETCPNCGAVFEVRVERFPSKDITIELCDDCGTVLKHCHDAYSYCYLLKSHGPEWTPQELE
jgi:hypothetical protein